VIVEKKCCRPRAREVSSYDGVTFGLMTYGIEPGPPEAFLDKPGHFLDADVGGGNALLAAEFLEVGDDLFGMVVNVLEDGFHFVGFVHG